MILILILMFVFSGCSYVVPQRYVVLGEPKGETRTKLIASVEDMRPLQNIDGYSMEMTPYRAESLRSMGLEVIEDPMIQIAAWGCSKAPAVEPPTPEYTKGQTTPEYLKFLGVSSNLPKAIICVIDTGSDSDHPDLADVIIGGSSVVSYTKAYIDDHGHGTMVSGVIAAQDNEVGTVGVNPNIKIYSVKAMDALGSGYMSNVADGILECLKGPTPNVINISLAGSVNSKLVEDAIALARLKGVLVVAAAGNEGGPTQFPAALTGVISVSALDNLKLAEFSNHGKIDYTAPGVGILTTGLNQIYTKASGTSFSAPIVSAQLATIQAAKKLPIAKDIGLKKSEQGKGLIDLGLSLN